MGHDETPDADADQLAVRIADALRSSSVTVAVAESLTGGSLAARLAAAPDSSEWFRGGIVAEEQLQGRILCDLYYIDNWSIWLDIKILFSTVFSKAAHKNAY